MIEREVEGTSIVLMNIFIYDFQLYDVLVVFSFRSFLASCKGCIECDKREEPRQSVLWQRQLLSLCCVTPQPRNSANFHTQTIVNWKHLM